MVNNAFNLAKKKSVFLLHGIYLGIKTLHFAKENEIVILYPPHVTVSISCNHLTELFGPLEKWSLLHKKHGWEKNPGKVDGNIWPLFNFECRPQVAVLVNVKNISQSQEFFFAIITFSLTLVLSIYCEKQTKTMVKLKDSNLETNARMPSALWASSDYHYCCFDDLWPFEVLPFENNNDRGFDIHVYISVLKDLCKIACKAKIHASEYSWRCSLSPTNSKSFTLFTGSQPLSDKRERLRWDLKH